MGEGEVSAYEVVRAVVEVSGTGLSLHFTAQKLLGKVVRMLAFGSSWGFMRHAEVWQLREKKTAKLRG